MKPKPEDYRLSGRNKNSYLGGVVANVGVVRTHVSGWHAMGDRVGGMQGGSVWARDRSRPLTLKPQQLPSLYLLSSYIAIPATQNGKIYVHRIKSSSLVLVKLGCIVLYSLN